MNLNAWLRIRSKRYLYQRVVHLHERYGLFADKFKEEILHCVKTVGGGSPALTFFTPGGVVERDPSFFRELAECGVEIGAHSYSHLDLRQCPTPEAVAQLVRALIVCEQHNIAVRGFRCPYLSCTDELLAALPTGLFEYGSNKAIYWQVPTFPWNGKGGPVYETLQQFYHPAAAQTTFCHPTKIGEMLEIPVIVPDDLQMIDGMHLLRAGVGERWHEILRGTHARGDLYVLMFHLELVSSFEPELNALVQEARRMQPAVWVARLCEVSDWWREKTKFGCEVIENGSSLHLALHCTPRATVLARGVPVSESDLPWDEGYVVVERPVLQVPAGPRPFVGVEAASPAIVEFLRESGYIVETGELARRCLTQVTAADLRRWTNEVELVQFIEAQKAPLVKFGCWPGRAKSAMSITGDLDALTLLDFTARLVGR